MQDMGRSRKRQAVGRENYARKAPEYAVGQRVLYGGKIAHVTGVVYDRSKKAHVYTIRVENDAVQVAPGDLQRVAGAPERFSVGQQVTPARPSLPPPSPLPPSVGSNRCPANSFAGV